jgi:MoxR-like ATPase
MTQIENAIKAVTVWVANATYLTRPRRKSLFLEQILDFSFKSATYDENGRVLVTGQTIAISGSHGIGKSAFIKFYCWLRGFGYVGLSLPTIEIPDLYMPLPTKVKELVSEALNDWILEMHMAEKLQPGVPWVLHGMDWRRVNPAVMSALMEITNEHTLTGLPLDQLVAVVLDDNPVGEGYQGVVQGDIAVETRMPHFTVSANDIPWREALAEKFAETDLNDVFAVWDNLTPELRRICPPRVLDHILEVTLAGLPPMVGVPMLPSGRQKWLDANGVDVCAEILAKFARAAGVSYTSIVPGSTARKAMNLALERGWNLHGVGTCGIAKTASIKALPGEAGNEDLDVVIFSAANMQPGDLAMPIPVDGKIRWLKNQRLIGVEGRRKLVVFDEMFRATKAVKPQMLELFQERKVCGETVEAEAIWALNNPAKHGALTFRVGQADDALCSRFTVNIEITDADTDWKEYLSGKYGEETVKPFFEFRAHSLDDTGRDYVSPRMIETMIRLHLAGLDVENALPFMGKERIPVRLHDLRALLAKRVVLGFTKIIQEQDEILERLETPSGPAEQADLEMTVTRALQKTETSELEQHADLCLALVKLLPKDKIIKLLGVDADPSRQKFWTGIFMKL